MLFHFLHFSQCVVCMFGHKKDLRSYKSQSPLQRENSRLDYCVGSGVCDVTKWPIRISLYIK